MRIIFIAGPSGGRPLGFMPDDQLKVAVADCAATSRYDGRECRIRGLVPGIAIAHFFCLRRGRVKTKEILRFD